ncbi:hypothetical protein BCSJ1_26273, partial [Bacillus cereus SJ1]
QQFGVEARACERAAQLVAHGQQQRALGIQHLVNVLAHGVDGARQLAKLIGPVPMAHRNRLAKIPIAETPRAAPDVIQRTQQVAHVHKGQRREQEQDCERAPGDARALVP